MCYTNRLDTETSSTLQTVTRNSCLKQKSPFKKIFLFHFIFIIIIILLFKAAPTAYRDSQARGLIGALAAGLCHSRGNAGSLTK